MRFLASHVLFHWVLNCDRGLYEVFPEEIFPQICPETIIFIPKSVSTLSFVDLALINGFFNAFDFCSLRTKNDKIPIVFVDLLELLLSTSVAYRSVDNFCHFTVLKNCLDKISRVDMPLEILHFLKASKEKIWFSCLTLVHSYWDNRFSGVSELAIDIFERILNLIHRKIDGNYLKIDMIIENYLENFPFFIRGKYKTVAVLIEYVSLSEVGQNSVALLILNLGQQLTELGSTVAPVGTYNCLQLSSNFNLV